MKKSVVLKKTLSLHLNLKNKKNGNNDKKTDNWQQTSIFNTGKQTTFQSWRMVKKRTICASNSRYAGSFKIISMRYYLDTNILIFILHNDFDNIHHDVKAILEDYANTLLVSSVVLQELVLLFRIGKLNYRYAYKNEKDLMKKIAELNIQTVYFTAANNLAYFDLQIAENHKDMNDHLIISQAISDKIPLISSDKEFVKYRKQGLNFILNKR